MATSDKAFNQVKSILGKLDQRIDSLRERRVMPAMAASPAAALANPAIAGQTIGTAENAGLNTVIGGGASRAVPLNGTAKPIGQANPINPNQNNPNSPYGRAVPLRHVS